MSEGNPETTTPLEKVEVINTPFKCPLSEKRSSATLHKCVGCGKPATSVTFDGEESVKSEISNQDEIDKGRAETPSRMVKPVSKIIHVGYITRKTLHHCDDCKRLGVYIMHDGKKKESQSISD